MPKKRNMFVPQLALDRACREPLHKQLFDQIAESIRRGEIEPGARLPSTRVLSKLLGISRNTVLAAYDALVSEDWIRGECGSGMRVAGKPGLRSVGLRRTIREAQYPARTAAITDPDGNPLYLNY